MKYLTQANLPTSTLRLISALPVVALVVFCVLKLAEVVPS